MASTPNVAEKAAALVPEFRVEDLAAMRRAAQAIEDAMTSLSMDTDTRLLAPVVLSHAANVYNLLYRGKMMTLEAIAAVFAHAMREALAPGAAPKIVHVTHTAAAGKQ